MFTPEQFSAATKANIDAQLAILSTITSKAIESMEKVVELNLTVAKTSIEELNTAVKQAKDPQDFFSLTQPNADKALAYARHLASITSGAQAELTKAAEAHVAETNRKVIALTEEIFNNELFKNAPAGSENAIALFKSAIANVNAGYEQTSKSMKQTAEVVETAVNQLTQAATKATPRATGKRG